MHVHSTQPPEIQAWRVASGHCCRARLFHMRRLYLLILGLLCSGTISCLRLSHSPTKSQVREPQNHTTWAAATGCVASMSESSRGGPRRISSHERAVVRDVLQPSMRIVHSPLPYSHAPSATSRSFSTPRAVQSGSASLGCIPKMRKDPVQHVAHTEARLCVERIWVSFHGFHSADSGISSKVDSHDKTKQPRRQRMTRVTEQCCDTSR